MHLIVPCSLTRHISTPLPSAQIGSHAILPQPVLSQPATDSSCLYSRSLSFFSSFSSYSTVYVLLENIFDPSSVPTLAPTHSLSISPSLTLTHSVSRSAPSLFQYSCLLPGVIVCALSSIERADELCGPEGSGVLSHHPPSLSVFS